MKKLLYIVFIVLILTTTLYAFDLLRFGFIGPSSSIGPAEPVTDHYMYVDSSLHYLYIDGSDHKLLIDGN